MTVSNKTDSNCYDTYMLVLIILWWVLQELYLKMRQQLLDATADIPNKTHPNTVSYALLLYNS
jgi:hypothetical protein